MAQGTPCGRQRTCGHFWPGAGLSIEDGPYELVFGNDIQQVMSETIEAHVPLGGFTVEGRDETGFEFDQGRGA